MMLKHDIVSSRKDNRSASKSDMFSALRLSAQAVRFDHAGSKKLAVKLAKLKRL
jgi:hypothetical protein